MRKGIVTAEGVPRPSSKQGKVIQPGVLIEPVVERDGRGKRQQFLLIGTLRANSARPLPNEVAPRFGIFGETQLGLVGPGLAPGCSEHQHMFSFNDRRHDDGMIERLERVMPEVQDFFLDRIQLAGAQVGRRQNRLPLAHCHANDNVATAELVEIIREGAQRVQDGERIPAGLELQPFPFHALGVDQVIDVDGQIHSELHVSRELIRDYLAEVGSDLAKPARTMPIEKLGRQMNIAGGPEEAPFPLNVGLLFFNPAPHRFFPATQIDVVWFPQGTGGDKFTEKVFQGPVHHMLKEALDFIRRNYLTETVLKHSDRAEATRVANFPYAAIEEAWPTPSTTGATKCASLPRS